MKRMNMQTPDTVSSANLYLPSGKDICLLHAIDTTCNLTVPADTLVEPAIPGHELMNFPTTSFLIQHQASGVYLLYDLGCKKDFWNLPPPITETMDAHVPGIKVDQNLVDILTMGGLDVSKISAAIISHHHYDHFGDPSTFPPAMELVVGTGFSKNFLPGYPVSQGSPAFQSSLKGRMIRELEYSDALIIAGFRAVDYFSDGSLYVLDTPGHAIGHLSALVRTTKDNFVFLGGDICHFAGSFRPTSRVPMPLQVCVGGTSQQEKPVMLSSSYFTECHPNRPNARFMPYYQPCSREDSWYIDPASARHSIGLLKELDASERVLVLISHDPSLADVLPFFPHGTLNQWSAAGMKPKLRWRFLTELPIHGEKRKYLVDGVYRDGQRVKPLFP